MWLLDRVMTPLLMRVKALLGKVWGPGPTSAITLAQATACWVDLEEHPDTRVTRELANENLQADLTNTHMYNRNNRRININALTVSNFSKYSGKHFRPNGVKQHGRAQKKFNVNAWPALSVQPNTHHELYQQIQHQPQFVFHSGWQDGKITLKLLFYGFCWTYLLL